MHKFVISPFQKVYLRFFFPVFITGKQSEKSTTSFLEVLVHILRVLLPLQTCIKKFPSVSQLSNSFHPLGLSVDKPIENIASVLHLKNGDNIFPLKFVSFFSVSPFPQILSFGGGKDCLLSLQVCEQRSLGFSSGSLQ